MNTRPQVTHGENELDHTKTACGLRWTALPAEAEARDQPTCQRCVSTIRALWRNRGG